MRDLSDLTETLKSVLPEPSFYKEIIRLYNNKRWENFIEACNTRWRINKKVHDTFS